MLGKPLLNCLGKKTLRKLYAWLPSVCVFKWQRSYTFRRQSFVHELGKTRFDAAANSVSNNTGLLRYSCETTNQVC